MSAPIVAIVGRPNVGKSTLFNRLIRKRIAITDETPGVTRDRNYAPCSWNGRDFLLVDTGGLVPYPRELLESQVKSQVEIAIEESEIVILLLDNQTGIASMDSDIADLLRPTKKKVLVVANKVDNARSESEAAEFHRLGLGEVIPVGALGGRNIGELLDAIAEALPPGPGEKEAEKVPRIAILGRPNVGKSSLVNKLLGQEKMIVASSPGTTRDAIDTELDYAGRRVLLTDTAGLRKRARVREDLEFYTNLRAIRSIEHSQVALLLLDADEGLTNQDLKIAEEVTSRWRGLVFVVNKWDLVEKDTNTARDYAKEMAEKAALLDYVPVVFTSALTGQRLTKALDTGLQIYDEMQKRVSTRELNEVLRAEIERAPPAAVSGRFIRFSYVTQAGVAPPTFVFFCNRPENLQRSYLRFLENKIREHFGFSGCPIRMKFKRKHR
jgi:GTP-binding protein